MTIVDDQETHYALVSQSLAKFPPKLQAELIGRIGSYTGLFTTPPSSFEPEVGQLVSRLQDEYQRHHWSSQIDITLEMIERFRAQIIPITSSDYPQQLRQLAGAPALLYVRGDPVNLHLPQIAIVGSRRMTRGGEINSLQWSKFLADSGFTITSGLALGVDGSAHRGALKSVVGKTIAVMATGIDRIYPSRHRDLAAAILDSGGTLITEFHPREKPLPSNFPRRNRIISGLSLGVLVIEAAVRSGSLITARCALEQDREVFAIPGSIHSPQSKGCHLLIKQGAHLVESAADIMTELGAALGGVASLAVQETSLPQTIDAEEAALLEQLGFDPIDMDSLSRDHSLTAERLAQLLIGLELKGLICNEHGFYQRLV